MTLDLTPAGQVFMNSWSARYPETPPINYLFKSRLASRWMRIHSLPAAQRYAQTKADWDVLLTRQNAVIDHLVPSGAPVHVVFNWIGRDNHIFKSCNLERLGIFRVEGDEVEFDSWLLDDEWESGTFNTLLTMVADDQIRAFIIAPACLIAPYDGGMDVILKDTHTAHDFKRHFATWISPREDGL
jgi:hypothetical protein